MWPSANVERFNSWINQDQKLNHELMHRSAPICVNPRPNWSEEVDIMPSTWSREKYIRSLKYAAKAHNGQTVPGSDLPYVVHVTMVAMEVIAALAHEDNLNGDLAIECALLHDVIEDACISYEKLVAEFGPEVAEGVLALSKNHLCKSKQEKMTDSLARIKEQPREIWMVKLADRITNLQPPPGYWDAEKVERYRAEGKEILNELGEASPILSKRLNGKLRVYPLGG
jgi:(p)ppGpp synthase/HD superfamily hydrolase